MLGQLFPQLKKLRISQNQVTAEGLAHLANLSQLEELDLSQNSQLFDDALAPLGSITSLTKLNLWLVAITDEGVKHLASLTNMNWLNLDQTQLTDAGFARLKQLPNLKYLNVANTSISFDVIDDLSEAKEDLEVVEFEN